MRNRKLAVVSLLMILVAALLYAGGSQESPSEPVGSEGEISGELVIMNWLPGAERTAFDQLEEAFMEKYPGVTIRNVDVGSGGDERSNIRTALLSGDDFDLIVNTWPSFEVELAEAGVLRALDDAWDQYGWSDKLSDSWRRISTHDGNVYSVFFTAGNRSGVWYNIHSFEEVGLAEEPETWEEFKRAAQAYKDAGYIPITVGATLWAQTEIFENIYLRTAGVENAQRLVDRDIPWTHDTVKATLRYWKELLDAGYFDTPENMFALDWDGAIDQVLDQRTGGFNVVGTWVNGRAAQQFGLTPGEDFTFFQFPVIDPEYADTMSIDGKNLIATADSPNPEAANAFIDFVIGEEGANIIAQNGFATPSSMVDPSVYDANTSKYVPLLNQNDVFFVLDDLLPAELSSEYRTGLQRFLQNPTSGTIDQVTQAIEAKAQDVYVY